MPGHDESASAITYKSVSLTITLEPLDIDDRTASIDLRIEISYEGYAQSLRWSGRAWIFYSALDEFEAKLRARQKVALMNMSEYPILRVEENDDATWLVLNPQSEQQSTDGKLLTIQLQTDPGLSAGLAASFKAFPRWW